ncbi:MAG: glycosyltransferase family 4 protein [Candidatus Zixiibacteriota bacterium]
MPRILQITTSAGWGGRESLPLTLHRAWRANGVNAELLAGEGTELSRRLQGEPGALSVPRGRLGAARALRRVLSAAEKGERVDLISHFTRDLGSIRLASLGHSRVRLTVIKHVSPGPPKHDIAHRFLYRRVDRLLAVSEYVRAKCERTYPIAPSRTGVWHPGVDTERFRPDPESRAHWRTEGGVADSTTVLGYVARITPNKGLEDLINATLHLRQEGRQVTLWLVGSSSENELPYEQSLRTLAAQGGDDAVRFWGRREEVETLYPAFDIFVVPSRTEAFGLTTVEAMACGCPVVGFNAGGTAEIVEDGQTGVLADSTGPNHSDSLSSAIRRLLDSTDRTAMGERAREAAASRFSVSAMLSRLYSALGVTGPWE